MKRTRLLILEIILIILSFISLIFSIVLNFFLIINNDNIILNGCIIACGISLALSIIFIIIKLEQLTSYYKCTFCGDVFNPIYIQICFAQHFNEFRKLKCPNCKKVSWQRKEK